MQIQKHTADIFEQKPKICFLSLTLMLKISQPLISVGVEKLWNGLLWDTNVWLISSDHGD